MDGLLSSGKRNVRGALEGSGAKWSRTKQWTFLFHLLFPLLIKCISLTPLSVFLSLCNLYFSSWILITVISDEVQGKLVSDETMQLFIPASISITHEMYFHLSVNCISLAAAKSSSLLVRGSRAKWSWRKQWTFLLRLTPIFVLPTHSPHSRHPESDLIVSEDFRV